jgi:hypothetical protein
MSVPGTHPASEPTRPEVDSKTRLNRLAREMIQAAKMDDRERFDRLYSLASGLAYGAAWRLTGDASAARKLAVRRLLCALRTGWIASRERNPNGVVHEASRRS